MTKKICHFVSTLAVALSLPLFVSCKAEEGGIVEDANVVGHEIFKTNRSADLEIYFFDSDNLVNADGQSYERVGPTSTNSESSTKNIRAAECFLIKSGSVEALVDCGHQASPYSDSGLSTFLQKNVLKKIATLCDDGVLEYVFITHADMDHLANFSNNSGLLNAFSGQSVEGLFGEVRALKRIDNLIDFDSPMTAMHSYKELDSSQRLINSELYQNYLAQRGKLIENGTNYLPASALFSEMIQANGVAQSGANKDLGRPTSLERKTQDQLISESSGTSSAMAFVNLFKKNADYKENVEALRGELKVENERFYYSIPFNGCELRVLYNWYYDFGERGGFDSQDRNNISVCLELVKGDFKFVGLGDLGGLGEEGLLKYYQDTGVLKNVTLFKASHHGSTVNQENSLGLLKTLSPKIVAIIGCAQTKLDATSYDSSAAFVEQSFMDHLYQGQLNENGETQNNPYVLYTNVCGSRVHEGKGLTILESNPFFGDIKVSLVSKQIRLASSYAGRVRAYLSREINTKYENEHNKEYYNFVTRDGNKMIPFQNTDWFLRAGLRYGE